jgi:hypothetical protein
MAAAPRFLILALLAAVCLAPAALAQEAPPGELLPLRVVAGTCDCVLPTPSPATKYYLVVGALARTAGPFTVHLHAEASAGPAALPLLLPSPDAEWRQQVEELHQRLARARQQHPDFPDYPPAADPPRQRTFYLFTREHDFQDPAGYAAVRAELRATGRHCLVYVDSQQRDAVRPAVLDDIVRTFDEEVWPRARRDLGRAVDVDRDGRFAILLTGWLGKLCDGKVALGGFVRGSDFDRDLRAPFGNQCDLMYLNTDLEAGPHLRTLLAHEYTHAVVFSEHVHGGYLPEEPPRDEEGWLNEGLAHLAEAMHGYSWSNLDYRVSAFLGAPERYQLVVPDYYGSGLWRTPGNRGAAYLFLRWCAERHGPGLARELTRSSLSGEANLEAAMRERFADLFRQWTVALLNPLAGRSPQRQQGRTAPLAGAAGSHPTLRGVLGTRLLAGPRVRELSLAAGAQEVQLAGTSAAYFLLCSAAGQYARLTITAPAAAELQVSVVRLPETTGRLTLRVQPAEGRGAVRAVVTAVDNGVTLEEAAWERLATGPNAAEDTSFRPAEGTGSSVRCWFGPPSLRAGESRTSPPLALPAGVPVALKVLCTDRDGHRLAAWAVWPP